MSPTIYSIYLNEFDTNNKTPLYRGIRSILSTGKVIYYTTALMYSIIQRLALEMRYSHIVYYPWVVTTELELPQDDINGSKIRW